MLWDWRKRTGHCGSALTHCTPATEQGQAPQVTEQRSRQNRLAPPAPVKHIRGARLAPAGLDAAGERGHVGIQPRRVPQKGRDVEQGAECGVRLCRRLHPLQQRPASSLIACLVRR